MLRTPCFQRICSLRFQKPWQTLHHFNSVKCYFFLCLVLPDMLALQTAYGLTSFPDLRLTLVTHLSNLLEFRPFFTPLGINILFTTYLIKIQNSTE